MKPGVFKGGLLALLAVLSGTAAAGEEIYYDYATVLAVRPLTESVAVRIPNETCDAESVRVPPPAGDVRRVAPSLSLGMAIRTDAEGLEQRRQACRVEHSVEHRERITGYLVDYRYGGRQYTRRVDHHPGERIRVQVKLRPGYRRR